MLPMKVNGKGGAVGVTAVGAARDIELICANPDRVVEHGDQLIYCGGALADLYAAMGGMVYMALARFLVRRTTPLVKLH